MNTSTHNTNAARDAGHPLNRLRHHVTAAIERGDAIAIVERPAPSTYNRARAICSCRHHAFPCAKCEALKPSESTAEGTRIEYDGTIYTVTGKIYEYHAGRDEEITIVTLADDDGNECRATLDDLKGCRRWTSSQKHTLKSLLSLTGHHCQPYGGGLQVFHEPGATEGDPRYWSLTDAHVVGLLSGPSLHIVTTETVACVNACAGMTDPAKEIAALRAVLERIAARFPENGDACALNFSTGTIRDIHTALAGKGDK